MEIDLTWKPPEDLSDGTRKKARLYYEYLQRYAAGEKNEDIARELGVTIKSVRNYKKRAMAAGALNEGVDMRDGAVLMAKYVPGREPEPEEPGETIKLRSGTKEKPAATPGSEESPIEKSALENPEDITSEKILADPRLKRLLKKNINTWTCKECGILVITSEIIASLRKVEGLPSLRIVSADRILERMHYEKLIRNNEVFEFYKVLYLYEIMCSDGTAADKWMNLGMYATETLDKIITVADISENWCSLLPALRSMDKGNVLDSNFAFTNLYDNLCDSGIDEDFLALDIYASKIVEGYRDAMVYNKELELLDDYAGLIGVRAFAVSIGHYKHSGEELNSKVDLLRERIKKDLYLQPDEETRSKSLELLDAFPHIDFSLGPIPKSNIRDAKRYLDKPYNELVSDNFSAFRQALKGNWGE